VKTTFKLKINIQRNPLNFKSILWNHLQAFPIWWDYPFNIFFSRILAGTTMACIPVAALAAIFRARVSHELIRNMYTFFLAMFEWKMINIVVAINCQLQYCLPCYWKL
jgi:hypothetical protein